MPVGRESPARRVRNASSPPADAPTTTSGKLATPSARDRLRCGWPARDRLILRGERLVVMVSPPPVATAKLPPANCGCLQMQIIVLHLPSDCNPERAARNEKQGINEGSHRLHWIYSIGVGGAFAAACHAGKAAPWFSVRSVLKARGRANCISRRLAPWRFLPQMRLPCPPANATALSASSQRAARPCQRAWGLPPRWSYAPLQRRLDPFAQRTQHRDPREQLVVGRHQDPWRESGAGAVDHVADRPFVLSPSCRGCASLRA